jgi:hypothetical protein
MHATALCWCTIYVIARLVHLWGGTTLQHRSDIPVQTVATEDKTTVFVIIKYKLVLKRSILRKYIYLYYEERPVKFYTISEVSHKEACLSAYILRDIIMGLGKLSISGRMYVLYSKCNEVLRNLLFILIWMII